MFAYIDLIWGLILPALYKVPIASWVQFEETEKEWAKRSTILSILNCYRQIPFPK